MAKANKMKTQMYAWSVGLLWLLFDHSLIHEGEGGTETEDVSPGFNPGDVIPGPSNLDFRAIAPFFEDIRNLLGIGAAIIIVGAFVGLVVSGLKLFYGGITGKEAVMEAAKDGLKWSAITIFVLLVLLGAIVAAIRIFLTLFD